MPAIQYTPELQASYSRLFDTCIINTQHYPEVNRLVKTINTNRPRYESVGNPLGIPWYFIGIVHGMECGHKLTSHLHNGDPLTARTVKVPAGRPKTGSPPFTWEFSATDALVYDKMDQWKDWSIPGILFKLEGYNGFGYRRLAQPINSPYLWSYTNQYTKGKYVKDGVYSPTAVSKQCGAAAMLRRLVETQSIDVNKTSRKDLILQLGTVVTYAPSKYVSKAEELQKLLNLEGAHLRVDGKAGKITSDAYRVLTGKFLPGDPRTA
ncbi:MAG: hypothetical protein JNL60_01385 [Bacteroidia bacterium]|nr:hypothetical protein [Bacteroidia bacterium]